MRIILEQFEIQSALDAYVRSQIAVMDDQQVTVRLIPGDPVEAMVSIGTMNASEAAPPTRAAPKAAGKRGPKPNISNTPEDRQPPADTLAGITELTDQADAIINDEPTPTPVKIKTSSIFAKIASPQPQEETSNDAAVTGDFAEQDSSALSDTSVAAPVEVSKPKSIFSFPKSTEAA